VVALVLLAIGIVYLTVPAKSLSVIPGHIAGSNVKRTKRGWAGIAAGVVVLIAAAVSFYAAKHSGTSSGSRPVARPEA
jgi:hypothetical protein